MSDKNHDRPSFHISVVADLLELHPQTIRNYERIGLITPHRTEGNVRLFSEEDVERVRKIQSYTNIGVNLAGVEIIMKLLDQMDDIRKSMDEEFESARSEMKDEIKRLRSIVKRYTKNEKS